MSFHPPQKPPKWRTLLGNVQTGPAEYDDDGNVVAIPRSLDLMMQDIITANNELVTAQAESARVAEQVEAAETRYKAAQQRLVDRLLQLGIRCDVGRQ